MRLDTFKGIDIHVHTDTGRFSTDDPKMDDDNLDGLKKQITAFVKKRRREGFKPIPVVVVSAGWDDPPVRGELLGISGTNGSLRIKGYSSGWRSQDLVFHADHFPEELFKTREKLQKQLKKAEKQIESMAYKTQSRGRLNATELIRKEREIRKALTS